MNERTIRILTEIGLTKNESSIYYTSLDLGPSTALKLSKTTGIKRTTVYTILDSLQEKGLISIQTKGFKREFVAENPDKLGKVLENRKHLLAEVLPELTAKYFNLKGNEGFIKHYQGLESIKTIYNSLLEELKPGDFYLVISDQKKWFELDPDYFEAYKRKRAKLNLKIRLLLQDSDSARYSKRAQSSYGEVVKVFGIENQLLTNMIIVPHKVIIVQTVKPLMALVIENQSVVQMNHTLFEMIWDSLV